MTQDEFKASQSELYAKIASALLDVIPEHWNAIELTCAKGLVPTEKGYGYSISYPDGVAGVVAVQDTIYSLYHELERLFSDFAKPWETSSFVVRWSDEIENWKYETNFTYG